MRSIAGANGLRSDMTHIAVTTAENQLVTIDMPESETKRVTVRQNFLVVEDKGFHPDGANVPVPEDERKPVVIPAGNPKSALNKKVDEAAKKPAATGSGIINGQTTKD